MTGWRDCKKESEIKFDATGVEEVRRKCKDAEETGTAYTIEEKTRHLVLESDSEFRKNEKLR
ncbi:unnamed protein product [Toxocara canis]|uniref:Uncharacterized protein n=1 Tax=Toxocara canis TaxID=6265 RepID=A0A183UQW0_TOXCA|nr:unnamed protein product [Toxocara canis]